MKHWKARTKKQSSSYFLIVTLIKSTARHQFFKENLGKTSLQKWNKNKERKQTLFLGLKPNFTYAEIIKIHQIKHVKNKIKHLKHPWKKEEEIQTFKIDECRQIHERDEWEDREMQRKKDERLGLLPDCGDERVERWEMR